MSYFFAVSSAPNLLVSAFIIPSIIETGDVLFPVLGCYVNGKYSNIAAM